MWCVRYLLPAVALPVSVFHFMRVQPASRGLVDKLYSAPARDFLVSCAGVKIDEHQIMAEAQNKTAKLPMQTLHIKTDRLT